MSLSESSQVNRLKNLGIDKKFIIDKVRGRKWIFSVYYADLINNKKTWRAYPNFVSARYLTKDSCIKAIEDYNAKGSAGVSWYDEKRVKA